MVVLNYAGAALDLCHEHRSGLGLLSRAALLQGAIAFCLFVTLQTAAAQSPVPEYRVKAVFLFQFTQFIDWPSDSFSSPDAPFVIGILGEDPFGSFLDDTVREEKKNNHPLIIQRYQRADDFKNCHLLFVSKQDVGRVPDVTSVSTQRGVLTVSDADDFLDRGGTIQFVMHDNRVHLRINLATAKSANLTISSKLLRLARVINPVQVRTR
jgi:YfiR/HmsC-like